jgi:1-acyl-sn-glycerol-3-phosphate acyltransferase
MRARDKPAGRLLALRVLPDVPGDWMTRAVEDTTGYEHPPGRGFAPASLFRNRNFLLLWSAYGVSALGDHLSEMALLKTQNALASPDLTQLFAKITFVFMLPFFVLGPFTGVLSDRLPRRGLMVFADLVRAGLMFSFAWLILMCQGWGPWGPFLPLLVVGVFSAIFSPARSALVPTLICPRQLVQANAMISGLGVIATMISMKGGGYLATYYHPQVSFRLDALSFVGSAVLLSLIWLPRGPARLAAERRQGGVAVLKEGFAYIARHRRVAELLAIAVLIWSVGSVVRSTIPAVVRDVYGRHNYSDIGSFEAFLGVGILTGSLILTALGDVLRSEIAITWSLMGIGGAIGVLTLSVLGGFSPTTAMCLGAVAIVTAGAFSAGVMASYNALMQRIVPDYVRGRVFGVMDLATIAGLLVATGVLGIPYWPRIDRWVGYILLAMTAVMFGAGVVTLVVRLRRSPFGFALAFWRNVNEFYCRWWFRLQREGPCTVPREGPVIVVANHTCTIDPLLLIATTPRGFISFMIAAEYNDLPLFSRLTHMIECIPVKRDGFDVASTRRALRHLRAGKVLGIFPEGRIPAPGERVEPKPGAAMLALHSRATVVPVHISGTRYHPGIAWSFFRRHHARVHYGKPIDLSAYYGHEREDVVVRQVASLIMERIRRLGTEEKNEKSP